MATKYVAYYDSWTGATTRDTMTVHEPEPATPVKTKLLDKRGVPLYRMPEPKVLGFFQHKEK